MQSAIKEKNVILKQVPAFRHNVLKIMTAIRILMLQFVLMDSARLCHNSVMKYLYHVLETSFATMENVWKIYVPMLSALNKIVIP